MRREEKNQGDVIRARGRLQTNADYFMRSCPLAKPAIPGAWKVFLHDFVQLEIKAEHPKNQAQKNEKVAIQV